MMGSRPQEKKVVKKYFDEISQVLSLSLSLSLSLLLSSLELSDTKVYEPYIRAQVLHP